MPGGIQPPMEELLSWPIANYENPVTQPKYVLIFSCIIGPMSIALLLARIWVRVHVQHSAGWDDWLMLAAAFPVITLTIIFPLITEIYRFDRHIWDVEPEYFPTQRKFITTIYSLFSLASGLTKLSVLLFYRRISSRVLSPAFRWTMRLTIVVVGGYSVAFMLIPIFSCRPIAAFWDQLDSVKVAQGYNYQCSNEGADVVAHGIISTIQDLVVAFLPTLLCWNLQMPNRQKFALYGIFAVGYSTVAIGAMRTYSGYRIFFQTYDVTWAASDTWLWSLLELHIGSMCANAPALKIFFTQVLKVDRLTTWRRPRSRSQSYGSKKQHSNKSIGMTGTHPVSSSKSRVKALFEKVFHMYTSESSYRSQPRTMSSTDQRHTILQKDTHYTYAQPTPRDSMVKPLASKYLGAILEASGHDSYMHDLEMNRLSKSLSSVDDDMQALPSPQQRPATPVIQALPKQPPLSQVRTSWHIEGKRYVWRPWERNAKVLEDRDYQQV